MMEWEYELDREAKRDRQHWNDKIITTSKQWTNNADGAREPGCSSFDRIYEAVRDYYNSRDCN